MDSTISEPDALALLQSDLDRFVACVDNSVGVDISENKKAALYSLTYNIGCSAFQNSTLLADLNRGDFESATSEFARWNQANHQVLQALVDRRQQEADLFVS
jgi:lysozyme